MTEPESYAECPSDVLVYFSESLHIFTGLLTVATVCGGFLGIVAAALLYVFCLKPILITGQSYDARRLFETDDLACDNNQSECVSTGKIGIQSGTISDKEKKQPPMNSDVAAFASRAKVVYPINQKYRPLADGASNPSLHEHSKVPNLPNGKSSSSSSGESLSQDQDNDSQFISSLFSKSLQNENFTRVTHYPHTLFQSGFEARISLYCLALQDIQQKCSQVQEEKHLVFLQTLKIIFSRHFPRDKKDRDFFTNVLLRQEKELEELKKQQFSRVFVCERHKEISSAAPCTLEEMERTQKDILEHGLQMAKGFSKQIVGLCQNLLGRTSVLPEDNANETIQSLIQCLKMVENNLTETQASNIEKIQEKLLWWEELTGLLQSQPALLRQEVALRQILVARSLEQLTSDGHLTFALMEKTLSDLQCALTEGLQQCSEECGRQTKELVSEKCRRFDLKKKKLHRTHKREKSSVLDSALTYSNPQQFVKAYEELLVRQGKQSGDLELQQDGRVAEVACELWRRLHFTWSKKLEELAKEITLTALIAQSQLSTDQCEKLWQDLDRDLISQQQVARSTTKLQLEGLRAQLAQDGQLWCEEATLALACVKHLGEQQMKILKGMVVRQYSAVSSQTGMMIEEKQHILLAAVQRHFVARQFGLGILKEMRLSKLKVLLHSDFKTLVLEDHRIQSTMGPPAKNQHKDIYASFAERHLGPETHLIGQSFQQEFLSELETGAELLQSSAQLLVGYALSHHIWKMMEARQTNIQPIPQTDEGRKCNLIELALESVYLTKDSLSSLVQEYYSKIQELTKDLEKDHSASTAEVCERHESSSHLNKTLLKELANWGKKPTSYEFKQRVEFHKRKMLEMYNLDGTQWRKKLFQDQTLEKVKEQLQEAEEAFIAKLAAHARVHLSSNELNTADDNTGEECSTFNPLLNPMLNPALNPMLT
ncbi:evC complex member EVC isoform X1 [Osmerus mordax]|uniref:evC complex member EVC isoform X1 n=1 Tax=Osmerus mordax TaxID=8014 RepID=UPI00350FBD0F